MGGYGHNFPFFSWKIHSTINNSCWSSLFSRSILLYFLKNATDIQKYYIYIEDLGLIILYKNLRCPLHFSPGPKKDCTVANTSGVGVANMSASAFVASMSCRQYVRWGLSPIRPDPHYKTEIVTGRFIVLEWLGQLAHREYRWQFKGTHDMFQYSME